MRHDTPIRETNYSFSLSLSLLLPPFLPHLGFVTSHAISRSSRRHSHNNNYRFVRSYRTAAEEKRMRVHSLFSFAFGARRGKLNICSRRAVEFRDEDEDGACTRPRMNLIEVSAVTARGDHQSSGGQRARGQEHDGGRRRERVPGFYDLASPSSPPVCRTHMHTHAPRRKFLGIQSDFPK